MKKKLILFSLLATLSASYSISAADIGKYDGKKGETYSEYLERKNAIIENVSGTFSGATGPQANTLTFSQAHIKCTEQGKILGSGRIRDKGTDISSAGDLKVSFYNSCMAKYAPFLEEQEGVDSCSAEKVEWGDYGSGKTCFAELAEIAEFKTKSKSISADSSVLVQNQNNTDSFQGFARVVCEEGNIKVLDSQCTLVPDPCEAGDIIGDPDRLPSRYKDNENWRTSHLWPVTEPNWAKPNAAPFVVSGDPKNIDRAKEFKNKVALGQRQDYCYAQLSSSNAGTLNTSFPVKSGDLIVNPKIDNTDAFFDKENSNGVFRCFDGEFYNEGSSCQYVEQSCDSTTISVPNGKGQSCSFNLPNQKHNATFTNRNPLPENSLGHVKAFCWDGQWEIWEESCNLSCENSVSGDNWNSEDGDVQSCNHSAKVFTGRTAPTAILTINNENKLLDGSKSYKCDNGEWVNQSQSCMPKSCTNLSANNWSSSTDPTVSCSHQSLGYSTPHNKTISTSANNGSNATVGYISYQCRYGEFVDITDYAGEPEYAPTRKGFSPSDKNCTSTIYPPQCYFDENQTEPSKDPSIFIDKGDGCYIECRVDSLTGVLNCTKSCTNKGSTNPDKDCFFPGGFSGCEAEGWYGLGTEISCPNWKSKPQVCNAGSWKEKNIPAKKWDSKVIVAFSEILNEDKYVDANAQAKVKVIFGKTYNNFSTNQEFGFGNVDGTPLMDKVVTTGSGSDACKNLSSSFYGTTQKSDYCFVKAEQTNVKDWQVFFDGTNNCSLAGAKSGEWTTNNITVDCKSKNGELPATANVSFVIRYNDGLTLTSPKISLNAAVKSKVVPAGYCPSLALVSNISSDYAGKGCNTSITVSNSIQAKSPAEKVREIRYNYIEGVCYESEYTGSLMCVDDDPVDNHEALDLVGTLSCVSKPVSAALCGVSVTPKWETEISTIEGLVNTDITLEIPYSNANTAYKASSNLITLYTADDSGCDTYNKNCYSNLKLDSGYKIDSWAIASISSNAKCTFKNSSKTANMKTGLWYKEAANLTCNFDKADKASVVLDFRLVDGTMIRTKSISLISKN